MGEFDSDHQSILGALSVKGIATPLELLCLAGHGEIRKALRGGAIQMTKRLA